MEAKSNIKKKRVSNVLFIIVGTLAFTFLSQFLVQVMVPGIHAEMDRERERSQNEDSLSVPGYAEGEVLVTFKNGVSFSTVNNIVDALSINIERHFSTISRIRDQVYVHLKSETKTTWQMMEELRNHPDVSDVSPNYILYADTTIPNDPRFNELWGLHNTGQTGGTADVDIDAPEAWDKTTGSSDVIVAVIDTGVDYNHPDLAANIWVNPFEIIDGVDNDGNGYIDDIHGINAITGSGEPMDDNGHGTHCSGTIGAVGNNGLGVVGVNWNVTIMGTKFLNANGSGSTSNAITCLDYIIEEKTTYGQNIVGINASWGGGGYSQSLKDAIDAAGTAGIVFCAAAGNSGTNNDTSPHYPSSYTCSNIVAVTAVDHNGNQYYNYGPTSVDLGAPGRSILSTLHCVYTPQQGDIFFDDMENGGTLWTHGGTLDSWGITNAVSGGLENYWWDMSYGDFWSDSPGVGYVHNVDNWLETANDIDLSSYVGQTVYMGIDGGFQMDYFVSNDTAAVEVSDDGGSNWYTFADLKTLYYGYGYYYLKQVYVIPDAYKTAHFRFRFHITSDDTDYSYYGYKNKGWIIDNIGIGTNVACGYGIKNGTSMATPHVIGAVAFIADYYPSDSTAERIARLLDNVAPLPSLDGLCVTGGLLNLDLALGAPMINVTSPDGGEYWEIGSTQTITWSSTGAIENVNIEYSIDNGNSWTEIIASTSNDGSYEWTVPDNPSDNCLIRISDTDGEPSDVSDAVFFIVTSASITITTPNGGENWAVGSSHHITWTSSGTVDNVKIEYSTDNGSSWINIAASTANDGSYQWTIPDNPSDNCLVRVSDTDGIPSDVSNAVFSIVLIPSITVTSPNGGENWEVASTHKITWDSVGIVGTVKIQCSIDNGITWRDIAKSTHNDGYYQWEVPDALSENCLIRISETNGHLFDVSDSVFSIVVSPSITVTSPNGGEIWQMGSSHNITWTSTGIVESVKIECSLDNGYGWRVVAVSTPNDGIYRWRVPDNPSENCLIRISDTDDSEPLDISDNVFAIVTDQVSSITVTSPNGGEVLTAGLLHNITWESTGPVSTVEIEYSTNNGTSWASIVTSANYGSYTWTVPDNPSNSCLIRISETDGEPSPANDVSDAVFFIVLPSSITVTSPNGGENLTAGSIHEITWTTTGTVGNLIIEYSTNSGTTWINIVKSTENDGSYNWTVPNTPSQNCLVRINEKGGDICPTDTSNAEFSILSPKSTITVISPNGREILTADLTHEITWTSTGTIDNLIIEYSTNTGTHWTGIVESTENDGSYNWMVPDKPSDKCLVRIRERDNDEGSSDISNAEFSIISPLYEGFTVISPNGGENLYAGWSHEITWSGPKSIDSVKIEYSIDSGTSWTDIIASTPNDGSYEWIVPVLEESSVNCLIRVGDTDGDPSDVSDAVFSILFPSTITITSPNGGETLYAGSIHGISWTSTGTVGNVAIEYSINSGASWNNIMTSTENDGAYHWTVPGNRSDHCLVRIRESKGDTSPWDVSDAEFSIDTSSYTSITVTSPNGEETLYAGSTHEITWTSIGIVGNVKIEYTIDSGTSWTEIVESITNDGIYEWVVPEAPSTNCLVRVSDTDGDPSDVSDDLFEITSDIEPTITITSPNGGENLDVGSTHNITWTTTGTIDNVIIEYSTDEGYFWKNIVNAATNDGSYHWTIPDTPSNNCLIRISGIDEDIGPWDVSDAVFSITAPFSPTITVTSPNRGESLVVGSLHEITWTSNGEINNVIIEYSADNGTTWMVIIASTPNEGSYEWTVPDDPSNNCLVRISGADTDDAPWDVSDTVFSIVSDTTDCGESWLTANYSGSTILTYVTYGNSKFAAVGNGGTIMTSSNAMRWTSRSSGTNENLHGIVYGGNTFAAIGDNGVILTSSNGITWETQSSNTSLDLRGIAYGWGNFVAVGVEGVILRSSDGITWVPQPSGTSVELCGIIYGAGKFAVVGNSGMILTSSDGLSWTKRSAGTTKTLYGITYGGDKFVAVGADGVVLTSSNGNNWTTRISIIAVDFLDAAFGNSIYGIVGKNGKVLTSPDGIEWTVRSSHVRDDLFGIGFGNSRFAAVGAGTILYSLCQEQ